MEVVGWRTLLLRTTLWLLALLVISYGFVQLYRQYQERRYVSESFIFSKRLLLESTWRAYKETMLEQGTYRTLDKSQEYITTSEGQSYTMLRAVWMDDRETFDKSWQWTKDILQRPDMLFSWRFGKLPNGTYDIQTHLGGQNAALDADQDIALSLLMAYSRWNNSIYLDDARPIIRAIWEKAVVRIDGHPLLAANDLEKFSQAPSILVNPSYLSPANYAMFALADSQHDWPALRENSYSFLERSMAEALDHPSSAHLPPNWVLVDRQSGSIRPTHNPGLSTDYGYDAFRTPWRLALDYQWTGNERARSVLLIMDTLREEWQTSGKLYAEYSHDGKIRKDHESPAAYGANLSYFAIAEPDLADEIFTRKLAPLYDRNRQAWKHELGYYEDNFAWFGIALYAEQLPNYIKKET
jgi:endoglucanase